MTVLFERALAILGDALTNHTVKAVVKRGVIMRDKFIYNCVLGITTENLSYLCMRFN